MGSRVRIDRFEDMVQWRAWLLVQCNRCGRKAHYDPDMMIRWFKPKGWSTSLQSAGHRFVCEGQHGDRGCGAKNVTLGVVMPEADVPKQRPVPVDRDAPLGVDPEAWAKADTYEKRRLIRKARG